VIRATAPVRICDLGGWTDTWFGGPGRVVNLAVAPGVSVTIRPVDAAPGRVVIVLPAFGDRYETTPGERRDVRHPIVEAAIDAYPPPPDAHAVEILVESAVPPGAGTGSSAAVAVALIGALKSAAGIPLTARDAAYAAHRLEVEDLGRESGIQDQLSAALGGTNYIEIDAYPDADVEPLPPWEELGPCLALVYLGQPHDSSDVHRQVIANATGGSGDGPLRRLRDAATEARMAILARDLPALAQAMRDNTEAQAALHPALVGPAARRLIDRAEHDGALGWKVNGAGGDGGSVTLLSPDPDHARQLQQTLEGVLPIRLSSFGLHTSGQAVWTKTS
jgi:D-glycero-alpha-D-manno-heptose-7-phosphate kinase